MNSLLKSSKKLLVGIGLASCGAAVWAYLGVTEDKALLKATALYEQYIKNQRFFLEPVHATTLKWDFNWDKHHADPFSKTPDGRFLSEEEEKEFKDKLDKAKVTASRHLLLIRHGQYNLSGLTDAERILTDLGRQQAHFAAQRLKSLDLPYTRLVQSTMTRAAETASIISKELPDVPVEQSDLLREGMPAIPEPSESLKDCYNRLARDGPRIEAAFRRYFHRASPLQKQDSYEIFVCHANVIRYFVCRALQLAPEAWLRFSLHNCSLTWITIRPGGKVVVYTVGDCGYIPPDKLSTT